MTINIIIIITTRITKPVVSYLQQLQQTGHSPVPQVVQAVPGVVGVETFGDAVSGETAGLQTDGANAECVICNLFGLSCIFG